MQEKMPIQFITKNENVIDILNNLNIRKKDYIEFAIIYAYKNIEGTLKDVYFKKDKNTVSVEEKTKKTSENKNVDDDNMDFSM